MSQVKNSIVTCIQKYIQDYYQGRLIGISDLANYCQVIEGEIYIALVEMQGLGQVKIYKRYFCPEAHQIREIAHKHSFCEECDFNYPNHQLEITIYIAPLESEL